MSFVTVMNHNISIWYVTPKGAVTYRLRTAALDTPIKLEGWDMAQ